MGGRLGCRKVTHLMVQCCCFLQDILIAWLWLHARDSLGALLTDSRDFFFRREICLGFHSILSSVGSFFLRIPPSVLPVTKPVLYISLLFCRLYSAESKPTTRGLFESTQTLPVQIITISPLQYSSPNLCQLDSCWRSCFQMGMSLSHSKSARKGVNEKEGIISQLFKALCKGHIKKKSLKWVNCGFNKGQLHDRAIFHGGQ